MKRRSPLFRVFAASTVAGVPGLGLFAAAVVVNALTLFASGVTVAAQTPAPQPLANDGRFLLGETFATRATFSAVFGDAARARWIDEHNASLAGGAPVLGPRIGYLSSGSAPTTASPTNLDGTLVSALREAGFSPGRDASFEWRFTDGKNEPLASLAAELVRMRVDVIVTSTTPESLAARDATSTIPIVFTNVSDPIGVHLVNSAERPGANVTGIFNQAPGFVGKRMHLLLDSVPNAKRVAVLVNPTNASAAAQVAETRDAAAQRGVELHMLEVRTADELTGAFAALPSVGADALLVLADPLWNVIRPRVLEAVAQSGLPTMHSARTFPDEGGLMSYSTRAGVNARLGGEYVARILKGAKPSDLPVIAPSDYEFVVNLRNARANGVNIPEQVLARATEIIR